jgi:hypothetical protein
MLYKSLILRARPKGTESLRRQLAEPYRTLSRAYDLITITLKPILPHDRQNRLKLKRRFSGSNNLVNDLLRLINGLNS